MEKVVALFIASDSGKRTKKEAIEVNAYGVIGDKFYGKDPSRAILLTSMLSYEDARAQEIDINLGGLSENIVIDGNPFILDVGQRLRIGNVLFEVTSLGTLCKGLKKIHPKLPKAVAKRRGIYIKALEKGAINVGDMVMLDTK